jgi:pyrroloquinoline quinone biosynthesis protein B
MARRRLSKACASRITTRAAGARTSSTPDGCLNIVTGSTMPSDKADSPALRALVLGSGAGGGVPQWNCGCRVCRLAWSGDKRVKPRTQSSLAVSANSESWLLLNASIDLRQQVLATPSLQPNRVGRASPIAAVVLTNADIDHAAGLLAMRERQPFTIFGTPSTLDMISVNPIFEAVDRSIAPRRPVRLGEPFEPLPGLLVELFSTPGKAPLWLEGDEVKTDVIGEGTVGVSVEASGRRLIYAPGCASMTDALHERIVGADIVFFDGTLFADDEMIVAGLGEKTGRRMGHMPISGPGGTLHAFARHDRARRVFTHINNSNPILIEGSPEESMVKAAGWEVAFDGMEIRL